MGWLLFKGNGELFWVYLELTFSNKIDEVESSLNVARIFDTEYSNFACSNTECSNFVMLIVIILKRALLFGFRMRGVIACMYF